MQEMEGETVGGCNIICLHGVQGLSVPTVLWDRMYMYESSYSQG